MNMKVHLKDLIDVFRAYLTESDCAAVEVLTFAGEEKLAYSTICEQLEERQASISASEYAQLERVGMKLGIPESTWNFVNPGLAPRRPAKRAPLSAALLYRSGLIVPGHVIMSDSDLTGIFNPIEGAAPGGTELPKLQITHNGFILNIIEISQDSEGWRCRFAKK